MKIAKSTLQNKEKSHKNALTYCIFQIKMYFTINKLTTHKKTTTASDSSSTLYTNLTTCVLPCGLSWVRLPPLLCTDLPIVRLSVSLYRLGLPYNVPTFSF